MIFSVEIKKVNSEYSGLFKVGEFRIEQSRFELWPGHSFGYWSLDKKFYSQLKFGQNVSRVELFI